MASANEPAHSEAEQLIERELLRSQRELVGRVDMVGILACALFVSIALRDVVSTGALATWSALVTVTTFGWSERLPLLAKTSRRAEIAVSSSALVWAVLPWLAWPGLDQPAVAWIVTAVCGYGLATDALLLPQTFRTSTYPLMFTYYVSYVVALSLQGHVLQVFGLTIFVIHLGAGLWGFERIKRRLIDSLARTEVEAYRDQLTGLPARGAAIREIERRLSDEEPVHVLVIDVDDFKSINTHLGHHGGDAALRALSRGLERHLRGWFVARLGGDEFVAVNRRGLHPSEQGRLTVVDVGDVGSGGQRLLSLSIGASSTQGKSTPDTLLTEASAALQRAKRTGKQRMVVADDDLRAEERRRQDLAAVAHRALSDGEIVAWGQPIIDLATGARAGMELLARWPRQGGVEMPGSFVPVMEAHGLGALLGAQMIDHGIAALERLSHAGDHTSFVSVNLSALSMLESDLAGRIAVQLNSRAIAPNRLIIEITESQRLPETDAAREAFDGLRRIGIGIASDDIGAGWSSINQMIENPFTHVKVDRTLINASHRRGGGELIASICTMAAGVGQVAIAEGIETTDELERVTQAGFTLGQGHLLGRPEPLEVVLRHFRTTDRTTQAPNDPARQ